MIQENIVVEVEKRAETGKNASNRYRAADQIPAVLYGGGAGMDTMSLVVPRKVLVTLLRKGLHENAIFELQLKDTDQKRHVMIRDLTVDPITRSLLHVDFVRILLDKKLRVKASVEITGIPEGVKVEGGVLNVVTHELQIECLPADIPNEVLVDVSNLKVHDSLRVSDISLGDKVKILEAPDRVIAHVGFARVEEVVAATATAEVVPTGSEPEVIKKGKKEEEAAAEGKSDKSEKKDKK
jgi:large subunit ribosomal protein L25